MSPTYYEIIIETRLPQKRGVELKYIKKAMEVIKGDNIRIWIIEGLLYKEENAREGIFEEIYPLLAPDGSQAAVSTLGWFNAKILAVGETENTRKLLVQIETGVDEGFGYALIHLDEKHNLTDKIETYETEHLLPVEDLEILENKDLNMDGYIGRKQQIDENIYAAIENEGNTLLYRDSGDNDLYAIGKEETQTHENLIELRYEDGTKINLISEENRNNKKIIGIETTLDTNMVLLWSRLDSTQELEKWIFRKNGKLRTIEKITDKNSNKHDEVEELFDKDLDIDAHIGEKKTAIDPDGYIHLFIGEKTDMLYRQQFTEFPFDSKPKPIYGEDGKQLKKRTGPLDGKTLLGIEKIESKNYLIVGGKFHEYEAWELNQDWGLTGRKSIYEEGTSEFKLLESRSWQDLNEDGIFSEAITLNIEEVQGRDPNAINNRYPTFSGITLVPEQNIRLTTIKMDGTQKKVKLIKPDLNGRWSYTFEEEDPLVSDDNACIQCRWSVTATIVDELNIPTSDRSADRYLDIIEIGPDISLDTKISGELAQKKPGNNNQHTTLSFNHGDLIHINGIAKPSRRDGGQIWAKQIQVNLINRDNENERLEGELITVDNPEGMWEVLVETNQMDPSKDWWVEINTFDEVGNKSSLEKREIEIDLQPSIQTVNGQKISRIEKIDTNAGERNEKILLQSKEEKTRISGRSYYEPGAKIELRWSNKPSENIITAIELDNGEWLEISESDQQDQIGQRIIEVEIKPDGQWDVTLKTEFEGVSYVDIAWIGENRNKKRSQEHSYVLGVSHSSPVGIVKDKSFKQIGNSIFGEFPSDQTGAAISLANNVKLIAVGSPGKRKELDTRGSVDLYELKGNKWNLVGETIYGPTNNGEFGAAIALSPDGKTLAVGSPNQDTNKMIGRGNVSIFRKGTDGIWTIKENENLKSTFELAVDQHSTSVTLNLGKTLDFLDNKTLIIGSNLNLKRNALNKKITELTVDLNEKIEGRLTRSIKGKEEKRLDSKTVEQDQANELGDGVASTKNNQVMAHSVNSGNGQIRVFEKIERELSIADGTKGRINIHTKNRRPVFQLSFSPKFEGTNVEFKCVERNTGVTILFSGLVDKEGNVSAQPAEKMAEGQYDTSYKATDIAGNITTSKSDVEVVVDETVKIARLESLIGEQHHRSYYYPIGTSSHPDLLTIFNPEKEQLEILIDQNEKEGAKNGQYWMFTSNGDYLGLFNEDEAVREGNVDKIIIPLSKDIAEKITDKVWRPLVFTNKTNYGRPIFSGVVKEEMDIYLLDGDTIIGHTSTINAQNQQKANKGYDWTITGAELPPGAHELQIKYVDIAGNVFNDEMIKININDTSIYQPLAEVGANPLELYAVLDSIEIDNQKTEEFGVSKEAYAANLKKAREYITSPKTSRLITKLDEAIVKPGHMLPSGHVEYTRDVNAGYTKVAQYKWSTGRYSTKLIGNLINIVNQDNFTGVEEEIHEKLYSAFAFTAGITEQFQEAMNIIDSYQRQRYNKNLISILKSLLPDNNNIDDSKLIARHSLLIQHLGIEENEIRNLLAEAENDLLSRGVLKSNTKRAINDINSKSSYMQINSELEQQRNSIKPILSKDKRKEKQQLREIHRLEIGIRRTKRNISYYKNKKRQGRVTAKAIKKEKSKLESLENKLRSRINEQNVLIRHIDDLELQSSIGVDEVLRLKTVANNKNTFTSSSRLFWDGLSNGSTFYKAWAGIGGIAALGTDIYQINSLVNQNEEVTAKEILLLTGSALDLIATVGIPAVAKPIQKLNPNHTRLVRKEINGVEKNLYKKGFSQIGAGLEAISSAVTIGALGVDIASLSSCLNVSKKDLKEKVEKGECSKSEEANAGAVAARATELTFDVLAGAGEVAARMAAQNAAHLAAKGSLQGAALGARLGGSTAIKVLGKAGPLFGVLAAAASVIDPQQWDAFTQMQDTIDDRDPKKNEASKILVKHLQDSLNREKTHYGVRTGVDAGLSLAGAALAASGVGLPAAIALAAVQAAVHGILLAVEQGEIAKAAEELKETLREKGGGGAKGVQKVFDQWRDEARNEVRGDNEKMVDQYFEPAGGSYDNVVIGYSLSDSAEALEIAAHGRIGEDLDNSAKTFFDSKNKSTKGQWNIDKTIAEPATSTVNLEKVEKTGKTNPRRLTKFVLPLSPNGKALKTNFEKADGDKITWVKKLKFEKLEGWTFKDFNDDKKNKNKNYNNVDTTFSFDDQWVSFAQKEKGGREEPIKLKILGGSGNDTFFGNTSEVEVIFEDKNDSDAASYASPRLEDNLYKLSGVRVFAEDANTIGVQKTIREGASIFKQKISEVEIRESDKRRNRIQFPETIVDKLKADTDIKDRLQSVEILTTTNQKDFVDLTGSDVVRMLNTLDGDDTIMNLGRGLKQVFTGRGSDYVFISSNNKNTGVTPEVISLGAGGDHIKFQSLMSHQKKTEETKGSEDQSNTIAPIIIQGGSGIDVLEVDSKSIDHLRELHSLNKQEQIFSSLVTAAIAGVIDDRATENAMNSQIVDKSKLGIIADSIEYYLLNLSRSNLSTVSEKRNKGEKIDMSYLTPRLNGVSSGNTEIDKSYFLADYRDLLNYSLSSSNTNVIFNAEKHNTSMNLFGSSHDDIIISGKGEVNRILGGYGNDVLMAMGKFNVLNGGLGLDNYKIKLPAKHTIIHAGTSPDELNGDIIDILYNFGPLSIDNQHTPMQYAYENNDLILYLESGPDLDTIISTIRLVDFFRDKGYIMLMNTNQQGAQLNNYSILSTPASNPNGAKKSIGDGEYVEYIFDNGTKIIGSTDLKSQPTKQLEYIFAKEGHSHGKDVTTVHHIDHAIQNSSSETSESLREAVNYVQSSDYINIFSKSDENRSVFGLKTKKVYDVPVSLPSRSSACREIQNVKNIPLSKRGLDLALTTSAQVIEPTENLETHTFDFHNGKHYFLKSDEITKLKDDIILVYGEPTMYLDFIKRGNNLIVADLTLNYENPQEEGIFFNHSFANSITIQNFFKYEKDELNLSYGNLDDQYVKAGGKLQSFLPRTDEYIYSGNRIMGTSIHDEVNKYREETSEYYSESSRHHKLFITGVKLDNKTKLPLKINKSSLKTFLSKSSGICEKCWESNRLSNDIITHFKDTKNPKPYLLDEFLTQNQLNRLMSGLSGLGFKSLSRERESLYSRDSREVPDFRMDSHNSNNSLALENVALTKLRFENDEYNNEITFADVDGMGGYRSYRSLTTCPERNPFSPNNQIEFNEYLFDLSYRAAYTAVMP
ncbi:Ig-like domain-containing protein [Synechococcus sp. RS9902]|uniref:Ig-like domain-containing protein n=1 Tax=Synechococcus sp. RS9902 TaxID=221345 RepID=UPI001645B388|nr:Ig-like domain-containing protein [Synechococcus sp. RS9902]QNI96146.1 bacterial Ig-like domain family protein [Synechococcus sp. RS9902]